jgi:hypothetical protein
MVRANSSQLLLIWRSDQVEWSPATEELVYTGLNGESFTSRDGDVVEMSASSLIGDTGEAAPVDWITYRPELSRRAVLLTTVNGCPPPHLRHPDAATKKISHLAALTHSEPQRPEVPVLAHVGSVSVLLGNG